MAVNIQRLGDNSAVVTYGLTDTKEDIYPLMTSFIQEQGWELYDDFNENRYVFRAPMIDDSTVYKYIELDWATTASLFIINAYENWNADTHTGVNNAMSGSGFGLYYHQTAKTGVFGTIWLFVTERYFIMNNRMQSDQGGEQWGNGGNYSYGHCSWTGVVEISKDNPNEVTGEYPRYAILTAGSALGTSMQTGVSAWAYNGYGLPRSISNTVVYRDTESCNVVGTLFGRSMIHKNHTSGASLESGLPNNANPFDLNTAFCSTLWALSASAYASTVKNHVRGRFYGVKALAENTGSNLDKIKVPCNSDYFYLSEEDGGVLKDHLIVASGMNSGSSFTYRWAIPL